MPFCLHCGSPIPQDTDPDALYRHVLACPECGCTNFTDDLPDDPINLWDFEESWRAQAPLVDDLRLQANQRELDRFLELEDRDLELVERFGQ